MDAIARDAGNDNLLLADLAAAYTRLGDILGNPTLANLGDRAGAAAAYAKALAILDPLAARAPDQYDFTSKLGYLLSRISSVQHMAGETGNADATAAHMLAVWEAAVRRFPNSRPARNGLAAAHFSIATTASDKSEKARHFNVALEIYQRQMAEKADDWYAVRNVALAHKYLGALYGTISDDEILRHLMAAEQLDSMRRKALAGNREAVLDHTFDISLLGTYFGMKKEYEKAATYFEQVISARRQMWEAEPKDTRMRDRMAYALLLAGDVYRRFDPKRARERLNEAILHAEALLAINENAYTRETLDKAKEHLRYLDSGSAAASVK
jgi:tetratricopeptide (TPR) repeat protein